MKIWGCTCLFISKVDYLQDLTFQFKILSESFLFACWLLGVKIYYNYYFYYYRFYIVWLLVNFRKWVFSWMWFLSSVLYFFKKKIINPFPTHIVRGIVWWASLVKFIEVTFQRIKILVSRFHVRSAFKQSLLYNSRFGYLFFIWEWLLFLPLPTCELKLTLWRHLNSFSHLLFWLR